jgi:diadenosine tetraphosphatase ApaH/serine/threonine PP2A family protein phosphatase
LWKLLTQKDKRSAPSLPEGLRVYAIGDIHGRADLLDRMFRRIDADLARHPASRAIQVFLGDYVDRGPASRNTLDKLIERGGSCESVFLKGNHESIMVEFMRNPAVLGDWRQYGGFETLLSYGLVPSMSTAESNQQELAKALSDALPDRHRMFLDSLKSSYGCGDFFFVHAGVKPGVALAKQRDEDLLWIRDEFLLYEDEYEKIVVHGHTPVEVADVRFNRINIDTGAYATGRLTCLAIEGDTLLVL